MPKRTEVDKLGKKGKADANEVKRKQSKPTELKEKMPKKTAVDKLGKKGKTGTNEVKRKQSKPTESKAEASKAVLPVEETLYSLQMEKRLLVSKLKNEKKELSEMKSDLKNLEFQLLRNPERKEEKYSELSKNVMMWSECFGMVIEQANCVKKEDWEWHILGTVDELKFELTIVCAKQETSLKGYVKKCTIETSVPCKQELEQWFENVECNVEQIFKVLKGYSEMNNARTIGLDTCQEKFPSLISVSQLEMSEGITVELSNEDAYFYKIQWKLEPCPKNFAKVINYCRLACTEDGEKYLKNKTELSSIKKKLSSSPVEIIQLLASKIDRALQKEKSL
ncbi:uncharacterized protein LOC124210068 isoform X2 [Daphnia pulex]|uniref:uncharacterized protein LOC124210068 isoform X2 n=1 Tax=Daphnia pulex TaxID=6669 RepID=UPI001EE12AE5|nr:uncharacterized protein LOC124210068 isoform X2 [Daphnia pulex]